MVLNELSVWQQIFKPYIPGWKLQPSDVPTLSCLFQSKLFQLGWKSHGHSLFLSYRATPASNYRTWFFDREKILIKTDRDNQHLR